MPINTPYPQENTGDFANRMRKQARGGSMVKAANRYLQTAEDKKQKYK